MDKDKSRPKKKLSVSPEIRELSADIKSAIKKPEEQGALVKLALFLGAGASFQSNIPVGSGMIRHFKNRIFERHGKKFKNDKEGNEWLGKQAWYKKGESDYCQLFEKCYKSEPIRRSYIESIIERKQPSVGYIVLANLIKYGYLKTILTTNFDSLVSLACSNYTDIFPVVYSLGNFASEMTVSSERPRILKLHGDFLFSQLKNTTADLDSPDENMERQVSKILEEYAGIIIIGYSGSDNSVMSIFEKIPKGKRVYWCDLSENYISERAKKFLNDKEGTFVQIEGFDELMQVIRILIELDNETITKTFQDRQIEIDKKIREFENVILVDAETEDEIENKDKTDFSDVLDKSQNYSQLIVKGNQAYAEKNYSLAEQNYRQAIELNPNGAVAHNNLGLVLDQNKNTRAEAEEKYGKAIELNPNFADAYYNLGILLARDENRRAEAEEKYNRAIELNPSDLDVYNNLGILLAKDENRRAEAEEKYNKGIELNPNHSIAYYNLACLYSLMKDTDKSFAFLKQAVEMDLKYKSMAKTDADFDFVRDDDRFWEIVGRDDDKASDG